jgi:hypothetical protein
LNCLINFHSKIIKIYFLSFVWFIIVLLYYNNIFLDFRFSSIIIIFIGITCCRQSKSLLTVYFLCYIALFYPCMGPLLGYLFLGQPVLLRLEYIFTNRCFVNKQSPSPFSWCPHYHTLYQSFVLEPIKF